MKKLLIAALLSIHLNCFSTDLEKSIQAHRDVLIKVSTIRDCKNPINPILNEYIGFSLFGGVWKQFTHPVPQPKLSSEEIISRNAILALLEKKALDDGRFDVYRFLRDNYDKTRFEESRIKDFKMTLNS